MRRFADRRLARAVVASAAALAVSACTSSTSSERRGIVVIATIQPLASLVAEVVGEAGTVRTLLPPGASPHTFEPLPRDVEELDGGKLLVRVGVGLDEWSERLLSGVDKPPRVLTVLELASLEPLDWPSGDGHGGAAGVDPHVWLDPLRMRDVLVPALARVLAEIDPPNANDYSARAARLGASLSRVDKEIRTALASVATRGFISYHDSWRYFAKRYRLDQVASIEAYAGDEPTAAELAGLIGLAQERDVRAVIMEPQLGERVARNIATELRARIEMADPLGDPTDPARESYVKTMLFNGHAFARALGAIPR